MVTRQVSPLVLLPLYVLLSTVSLVLFIFSDKFIYKSRQESTDEPLSCFVIYLNEKAYNISKKWTCSLWKQWIILKAEFYSDFFENSMNFNLSAFPNFLNISSCFKYVSQTSLFFGSSMTFSRFESWPLANRNSWRDGQTSYHLEPVLEPAGTWIPTHHNDTE